MEFLKFAFKAEIKKLKHSYNIHLAFLLPILAFIFYILIKQLIVGGISDENFPNISSGYKLISRYLAAYAILAYPIIIPILTYQINKLDIKNNVLSNFTFSKGEQFLILLVKALSSTLLLAISLIILISEILLYYMIVLKTNNLIANIDFIFILNLIAFVFIMIILFSPIIFIHLIISMNLKWNLLSISLGCILTWGSAYFWNECPKIGMEYFPYLLVGNFFHIYKSSYYNILNIQLTLPIVASTIYIILLFLFFKLRRFK